MCTLQIENEVRALEAAYDEAWNRGDVDALLACMTDDVLVVDPLGRVSRGRDEVRNLLAPLVAPTGGDSTHKSEIVRVEFVTPDIAVVDGRAHIEGLVLVPGEAALDRFHRFTDVVVRYAGQWKIAQIRACPLERDPSSGAE
jgi:uncharacterized protein (TIGR02246 family)